MQIPEGREHILRPTMIVVTGKEEAKLYYADNDELRHVEDVVQDTSFEHGGEGHARTAPGFKGAPTADSDRMHWDKSNRDHLYHKLNENLQTKLQNKEMEEIIVCVPEELKNELEEKLTPDVLAHVKRIVPKNLLKMNPEHLLAALEE